MLFLYNLYKDETAGSKNDHAMQKSFGHIIWVRVLGIVFCKEYTLKLYKFVSALEADKWSSKD
jgi:hypothetical protein